ALDAVDVRGLGVLVSDRGGTPRGQPRRTLTTGNVGPIGLKIRPRLRLLTQNESITPNCCTFARPASPQCRVDKNGLRPWTAAPGSAGERRRHRLPTQRAATSILQNSAEIRSIMTPALCSLYGAVRPVDAASWNTSPGRRLGAVRAVVRRNGCA